MNQITDNAFQRLTYVGPEQKVNSVLANIDYGVRKPGTVMYVHLTDVQSSPTLWVKPEDYVAVEPVKKKKRKADDTD